MRQDASPETGRYLDIPACRLVFDNSPLECFSFRGTGVMRRRLSFAYCRRALSAPGDDARLRHIAVFQPVICGSVGYRAFAAAHRDARQIAACRHSNLRTPGVARLR